MATTISNGESGLSVRNKLNDIWHSLDLNEIAATISDTAVDIFVYDTRKDSDGGAWRKRTQHTSWYNETLNTATRGSRREFPAVAVIVCRSDDSLVIYDGDDPDLPMWMVFNTGTGYYFDATDAESAEALNGTMFVCGGGGSIEIRFISDTNRFRSTSAQYNKGNIAQRNNNNGWVSGQSWGILVNDNPNDCAMTVLPNAPIDAATGLPVPTIAVATDGGVSVIKDDGTVVDITGTLGGSETKDDWVYFDKDGSLFMDDRGASSGLGGHYFVGFTKIPSADTTVTNADIKIGSDASSLNLNNLYLKGLLKNAVDGAVGCADATGAGLNFLDVNKTSVANSMIAYTTSDYATGWMNGDIKLATLSDTDDTNVTGSELVTNGDFATSSDWTTGAYWSIGSGVATKSAAGGGTMSQTLSLTAGALYVMSVDVTSYTSGDIQLYVDGTYYNVSDSTGTKTATFNAPDASVVIGVYGNSGSAFSVDNISVRLAEEDRSVSGNGLQVFGTVTKSAVATGADLVAYSGFSASNYLQQPYNSDLDFGTGDFCVMGWAKGADTNGRLLLRADPADDQNRFSVDVSSGVIRFFTFDTTSAFIESGYTIGDNWVFVCALRTGGYQYIYINGTSMGTPVASTKDVTNSNAVVTLGEDTRLSTPYAGSLALWRISATAPSPDQIRKIYEDEKVLFQDGAQATLYGSSDAVTALAYDDSTNLLHVGTSAGRSVFQGLRRVDNTTTAVGAAISASNGLVADE